jgi:hypothetical protein
MEFVTKDNCTLEFIRKKFVSPDLIIGFLLNVQYITGREEETCNFFEALQKSVIIPQYQGIIIQENQIILNDGRNSELILNVDEFNVNPSDFRILYDRFSDETKIITPNIVINGGGAKVSVWC